MTHKCLYNRFTFEMEMSLHCKLKIINMHLKNESEVYYTVLFSVFIVFSLL